MVHLWGLTMLDNATVIRYFSQLVLIGTLLLTGCSKSFVVTSEVPKPLIERLPIVAKMKYSDEFRNYQFIEKSDSRALEKVDFGAAQVGMFNQVFGNLFTLAGPNNNNVDLVIEPQILEFQYSVPAETKLKLYEIWLKYRLRITDHNDQEIADWVVKGYGKTPTSLLASQLKAFNTASNVALRDIGAQLAIGFQTQPSIEDFLNRKKSAQANNVAQLPAAPTSSASTEPGAPEIAKVEAEGVQEPSATEAISEDSKLKAAADEGSDEVSE